MCLIKTQVIEFGNKAIWSTRRVVRAPGTLFSWATCDETKVAALPRSRDQNGPGRDHSTLSSRSRHIRNKTPGTRTPALHHPSLKGGGKHAACAPTSVMPNERPLTAMAACRLGPVHWAMLSGT